MFRTSALSFREVDRILEAELGRTWRGVLTPVADQPIRIGAMTQTHAALLHGLVPVEIRLATKCVDHAAWSRADCAREQLSADLRWERRTLAELREIFADVPGVTIPPMIDQIASRSIFVVASPPGISFTEFNAGASQDERNAAGSRLLRFFLMALFDGRLTQAEPNPDLLRYGPEAIGLAGALGMRRVPLALAIRARILLVTLLRGAVRPELSALARPLTSDAPFRFSRDYAHLVRIACGRPRAGTPEWQLARALMFTVERLTLLSARVDVAAQCLASLESSLVDAKRA